MTGLSGIGLASPATILCFMFSSFTVIDSASYNVYDFMSNLRSGHLVEQGFLAVEDFFAVPSHPPEGTVEPRFSCFCF